MAATFTQVNQAALAASVAFVGVEFVHDGVTRRGIVNYLNTSEVIDFGGFQSHLSATISIGCDVMPVAPNKGDRLTIAGVDRRVINVTNNNGISWHISLEDISR